MQVYESHLYGRYSGYFYSPIILVWSIRDNLKSLIIIL